MLSQQWHRILCIIAVMLPLSTAHAEQTIKYRVTVQIDWTQNSHPVDYPASAHWSGLFAVTHNSRYTLFADGKTATTGLALLATNGRVIILNAEYEEAKRRNRVGETLVASPPSGGSGLFSFEIGVTENHSMISFATMLAPSPDWFAGLNGVQLRKDGGWLERFEAPIFVWDAGADSGASFIAENAETQPRESTRLLAHPAFLQKNGLKPIGTVEIVRMTAAQ